MANTAIVDYYFTGNHKQLEDLYEILETAYMSSDTCYNFHTVAKLIGINSIARNYGLRCDICNIQTSRGPSGELESITMCCEAAWGEQSDFRSKIIGTAFPYVTALFKCIETGNELYYSNDVGHVHFKTLYHVDIEDYDENEYETLDDVAKAINDATSGELDLLGCPFVTMKELLNKWLEYNDKCGGLHEIDYSFF